MPQTQQRQGQSIITQVSSDIQSGFLDSTQGQGLAFGNDIKLDLRGTVIELTKAELSQLPESILLGLSNGLCIDNFGNIMFSNNESEVAVVNFSPECLQFTLDVFREAAKEVQHLAPDHSEPTTPTSEHASLTEDSMPNVSELLRTKPAIIVLREDLDYYCLPASANTTPEEMLHIKRECGKRLKEHDSIFTGLQRDGQQGSAEQHLVNMLCSSGFSTDSKWGFRALEPNKTVVSSLALVRLKPGSSEKEQPVKENVELETPLHTEADLPQPATNASEISVSDDTTTLGDTVSPKTTLVEDQQHQQSLPAEGSEFENATETQGVDPNELGATAASTAAPQEDQPTETDMANTHKLLLFWRKPARRCWWDHIVFDNIPDVKGPVKVHIRSVWTLELAIIEH